MRAWLPSILLCAAPAVAGAQPYGAAWWTVDGGAGRLTSAAYGLDATAGQPDARPLAAGGSFALSGGFWPVAQTFGPQADLSLNLADAPDPVMGLQTLTYTIAVANAGPAAATNVTVTDTLPASTTFGSAGGNGWSCQESGGTVTCTRPTLLVGPAPELLVNVRVPPAAQALLNAASVAGDESDPVAGNDSDQEATTVIAAPVADLGVLKSDGGVIAGWSQPLTYTIAVSNRGPDAVTGALVQDSFPGLQDVTWTCSATAGSSCPAAGSWIVNEPVNLLSGGTATFTATGVVPVATYGHITNVAGVGTPLGVFDPVPADNTALVRTPVVPPDHIFADGFEAGDLSAWSANTGPGLRVLPSAASHGRYGLAVSLVRNARLFVQDDSPLAEGRYRARFYVGLQRLAMAEGDEFEIFRAHSLLGPARIQLMLAARGGRTTLRMAATLDDGTIVETPAGSEAVLSSAWNAVEIDWQAASAPGAHDGTLALLVNGAPRPGLDGLDTEEASIARVRLGVISGLDLGTSGELWLDEFVSRRHTAIGLICPGGPGCRRREDR